MSNTCTHKHPCEFFDMIDVLAIKPKSTFKSFKAMLRITFSEHKVAIFEFEGEPEGNDTRNTLVSLTAVSCYDNLHEDNFDKYLKGDWSEYLPKGKMIHRIVKNAAVAYFVQKTCEDFLIEQKTFTLDELTERVYKFLAKVQAELDGDRIRWRNELNDIQELIDKYDSKS